MRTKKADPKQKIKQIKNGSAKVSETLTLFLRQGFIESILRSTSRMRWSLMHNIDAAQFLLVSLRLWLHFRIKVGAYLFDGQKHPRKICGKVRFNLNMWIQIAELLIGF